MDGDGLAAGRGDGVDDGLRAGLAGRVVDDDRGALGGERLGDRGADAFRGAGDDGDLTGTLGLEWIPSENDGARPASATMAPSLSPIVREIGTIEPAIKTPYVGIS
jgi:hypothetical protein